MPYMSLEEWNARNELLDSFRFVIEKRTRGRLSDLSVELDNESVAIQVRATTYYAVQLTLAAIHAIVAEFPDISTIKLVVRVDGHLLVLSTPCADRTTSSRGVREGSPSVCTPNQLRCWATSSLRRHPLDALSSRVDSQLRLPSLVPGR